MNAERYAAVICDINRIRAEFDACPVGKIQKGKQRTAGCCPITNTLCEGTKLTAFTGTHDVVISNGVRCASEVRSLSDTLRVFVKDFDTDRLPEFDEAKPNQDD